MSPLADQLAALGLHHTGAHLDDLVALATKKRWSATQLLEHLATQEAQDRAQRSLFTAGGPRAAVTVGGPGSSRRASG